jgi:hypothetical protein
MANVIAGLFRAELRRARSALRAGRYYDSSLCGVAKATGLPPDKLDQEIAELFSGMYQDIEHRVIRSIPVMLITGLIGNGRKTFEALKLLKTAIKERLDEGFNEELDITDALRLFQNKFGWA